MHSEELIPIINMENLKVLPRNFRMTKESYLFEELKNLSHLSNFNLEGLLDLRASASGQFSEKSLTKILETVSVKKFLILDLREESHGFVNGIAVSWYSEKDWSNRNKNLDEILVDEKQRLQKALKDQSIHLYVKNSKIEPLTIHVNEVYSEAEMAQNKGVSYVRIPVTDHLKPSPKEIDQFIELIKHRVLQTDNSDSWIHFHCSAGRGRSTTFICMYDMMHHASKVSFDDILTRQTLLGGKDLSKPFDISDWRYHHHFERLQFLLDFYHYCLENPYFEQAWSSWINQKNGD